MSANDRKERERRQREKEIIDAAEELFIQKGYSQMTMDEVAKRAEFTKRTVYAYFAGKEDLACAIVTRAISHLNDLFEEAVLEPETGFEKIEATGYAFIRFAQSESRKFDVLCRNEAALGEIGDTPRLAHMGREMKRQLEIMSGAIALGVRDGSIKPGLDPTLTAIYLATFSTSMMSAVKHRDKGFLPQFGITSEEYISRGMEFFTLALRNVLNSPDGRA
jgi:AcrR family transcriptional regulator